MSDYGPNTIVPTRAEAERDEHNHSRCSFGDLCPACRRTIARGGR
jgi:hypothetical protein